LYRKVCDAEGITPDDIMGMLLEIIREPSREDHTHKVSRK